jgi:hypothetical protein
VPVRVTRVRDVTSAGPVAAAERVRNDLVHFGGTTRKNGNPFVDHPEWVVAIYGSTTSEPCALSKANN